MSQIHIKIDPKLHALLIESAKVHRRSLNSEVSLILENAIAKIPVIGKVENGQVEVSEEYKKYLKGESLDPRD